MNRTIYKAACLLFSLPFALSALALELDSDAEKGSDRFGLDIGRSIVAQDEEVDLDAIEKEVVDVATKAKEDNPEIGAFVLECTDLPTYSKTIRETTGCPGFDVVSLINFVYQAVAE